MYFVHAMQPGCGIFDVNTLVQTQGSCHNPQQKLGVAYGIHARKPILLPFLALFLTLTRSSLKWAERIVVAGQKSLHV